MSLHVLKLHCWLLSNSCTRQLYRLTLPLPSAKRQRTLVSWSSTTTSPRVSNITAVGTYETLKGSRQKKRIFYGQADRRGWPPPPYGQLFCVFFWGVHLTSVFDYKWFETNFDKKNVFWPFVWPFGCVKMSISNSSKRYNGTENPMKGSALDMHF